MSAKPVNEDAGRDPAQKRRAGFLRGFLKLETPAEDELHFILLDEARVPVALPRGRKLTPVDPRKPRGRW